MRFGLIKTLVENKLIDSFVKGTLKTDMRLFERKLLKNSNFCKLMSIDDLSNEFKQIKLSENTINFIKSWTKDIVLENKYKTIDELFYGDLLKPEKKSIAKKSIVESLGKKPIIKENKSSNVPISSMLKVANKTAEKYLENLTESERNSVKEVLTSNDENLKTKFTELKETAIQKIDTLISESDEELSKVLLETKERLTNVKHSKKEYIKLMNLTQNL